MLVDVFLEEDVRLEDSVDIILKDDFVFIILGGLLKDFLSNIAVEDFTILTICLINFVKRFAQLIFSKSGSLVISDIFEL